MEKNKQYRQGNIPSGYRYLIFIVTCTVVCTSPSSDLTTLTDQYNTMIASKLNDHAPKLQKNSLPENQTVPGWMKILIRKRKKKIEQKWWKTGMIVYRVIFVGQRQLVSNLIKSLTTKYCADIIEECLTDQKALFNLEIAFKTIGMKSHYNRICYEQPPMWHRKSGLLRQVAAHWRFICIVNVILGNGQLASHKTMDYVVKHLNFVVLQGSVLGPLLQLLYKTYLSRSSKNNQNTCMHRWHSLVCDFQATQNQSLYYAG